MKAHVFGKQDLQERAGIEIRKLSLYFDIPEMTKHVTLKEAGGEVKNIYEHLVLVSEKVIAENRFPGLGITNKYQLANIIKTIFYEAIESCSRNKQPAFIATVEKFRPDFVGGNGFKEVTKEDIQNGPTQVVVNVPPIETIADRIDDSEEENTAPSTQLNKPAPLRPPTKGPASLEDLSVKYVPNARKPSKPGRSRPSRPANPGKNQRNVGQGR